MIERTQNINEIKHMIEEQEEREEEKTNPNPPTAFPLP